MRAILSIVLASAVSACALIGGGQRVPDTLDAPGIARDGETADQLVVGHRLMAAGENELALEAFTRAAAEQGLNADTLSALGSANLRLGRLHQAERQFREAVELEADFPEAWNNLGVVLMELGETGEAAEVFRRAYATDDGQSDMIRDNLRLALAKLENASYTEPNDNSDFRLIERGEGDFILRSD
ncbi:tetratricopeptide repeat protein [Pelagovum pacificum]|uniref:Tetratricopeptide repeat protein n=1 Tax=Pelagovum pacificum TaxID=2588711 RepID=A0A5C5GBG1_9RHOB|nr:tetratricopeptide repeat protein [Pelagovum pacificum]QQA41649.1 tetratricopeptide repeat protein [Pelagovum pacificum]TNY30927.1 tetratricopeptide repeat protein [Pelagovum pacificum]